MAEPFIAEIVWFAGNFAPRGWAFCAGQILPIAQNTALFSLLGTTYGGNGQTTFALPDFQGRVAVGQGQGPGLPSIDLGEEAGSPTESVIITEMPAHVHTITEGASTVDGNPNAVKSPANAFPGYSDSAPLYATASNANLAPITCGPAGGSQPHNNMQPFLGMNYIIATEGVYPSRN
jgi:microcystin-dependent protein